MKKEVMQTVYEEMCILQSLQTTQLKEYSLQTLNSLETYTYETLSRLSTAVQTSVLMFNVCSTNYIQKRAVMALKLSCTALCGKKKNCSRADSQQGRKKNALSAWSTGGNKNFFRSVKVFTVTDLLGFAYLASHSPVVFLLCWDIVRETAGYLINVWKVNPVGLFFQRRIAPPRRVANEDSTHLCR